MKIILKSFFVLGVVALFGLGGKYLTPTASAQVEANLPAIYKCELKDYPKSQPPQIGGASSTTNSGCIRLAQELLKNSGQAVTLSGTVDSATTKAIKSYQTSLGLTCKEGIVGAETWNSLTAGTGFATSFTGTCTGEQNTTNNNPNNSNNSNNQNTSNITCEEGLVLVNNLCLPPNNWNPISLSGCTDAGCIIARIIKILLTFAGVLAVLMIIIGGFMYITSAGSEGASKRGKATLTYAVIGLALVLLAYTIVTVLTNLITQ